jgi:hypothetical protein
MCYTFHILPQQQLFANAIATVLHVPCINQMYNIFLKRPKYTLVYGCNHVK